MGSDIFLRTILPITCMLMVGCRHHQPAKDIAPDNKERVIAQSYFLPEVLHHALHHDKGIYTSSLFGQTPEEVLMVPDGSQYYPDQHLYVFTYYPVGCHGNHCNFTGLYFEPEKRFFSLDTDDYAFWVNDTDKRDDEQLKAFFDRAGVEFGNEFLLSSFLEHIFGFELESGLSPDSVSSRFEGRRNALQQAVFFQKPEGSDWSREDVIRHADSSRKDAISLLKNLQEKGYFIQWDFSFRDGTFVLVYIHPKELMDFGIMYF